MKKSFLMIFAVFAVALLAVAASGCLGSDDKDPEINVPSAPAQSVIIYTDGDNVMASVTAIIFGTHSQSLDANNSSAKINGTTVDITIPVINSDTINTRDLGYEQVLVVLGKKSDFKEGQYYNVTVGGEADSVKKYGFEFVDGQMYSYRAANIDNLTVAADGNNVTVTAVIAIGGGADSIDKTNITASGKFDENNEYDIYIPHKTRDGPSTMEMKWGEEQFVVGQLDKMENGTYTVKVNGISVSFTVENGKLTANA